MISITKCQDIKSGFTNGRPVEVFPISQVSEKEDTELENICEVSYYRREFKENISTTQNAT